MKTILFSALLALFVCSLSAQTNNIWQSGGISQTVGPPTFKPGAKGNIVAIDTVTGVWYVSRDRYAANGSWLSMGDRIESISGCSAPAYTPNKYNSEIVINNCGAPSYITDFPKLYQHIGGGVWVCLNCSAGSTYTAGTGIAISGSNVISNTAPDQTVSLTGAGGNVITGTYPSFTITGTPATGAETIVTAGTGASVTGAGTSGSPYVVSSTITQYTDELAQDAAGAMVSGNISFGTGAGTGPTLNSVSGTGNSLYVTFTTGTGPATSATIFTATYPTAYPNSTSWVTFSPKVATPVWPAVAASGSDTAITFTVGAAALTASTQYSMNFIFFGN